MYINNLQRKMKKAHLEMHILVTEEESLIDELYQLNKTDGWWEQYDHKERWDTLVTIKTRIKEIHDEIDSILETIQANHQDSWTETKANMEAFHNDVILEIHLHHAPAQNTIRYRHGHR